MEKTIFWDWNGTLLDDVDACVGAMNELLVKREMQSLDTDSYKAIFGFPVIDYYKKMGFDFKTESFEEISGEFINEYNKRVGKSSLHNNVIQVLNYFCSKNYNQVIISAMEQKMLEKQLSDHGIADYFSEIKGLHDILAKSKLHLAETYIEQNNIKPTEIFFIGDTLHDAEVAEAIGCNLALVSHGHYSVKRLSINGFKVFPDLLHVKSFIN